MLRRLPWVALSLLASSCASFDPDDQYRCESDDDCIAGYACQQAVCARLSATQAHRILYRRGGVAAHLLAVAPASASPTSLTDALDALGLRPEPAGGAFAANGAWLAFLTTRGHQDCDGYACLAVASGDLRGASLVIVEDTSGPLHPSGGPMDIAGDASRIVYVEGFQVYVTDRVAGEPLVDGRWSSPLRVDEGAPAGSAFAQAPVLLPAGDRIAWACGPDPYLDDGRGICQRTVGPGPSAAGPVERIGPDSLPGAAAAWLKSPRFTQIGAQPRIAFLAQVNNATNIWHAALDGTDAQQVTSSLAGAPPLEHLCLFGGRAVTLSVGPETYTLEWLDLGDAVPQIIESMPVADPLPALFGCH